MTMTRRPLYRQPDGTLGPSAPAFPAPPCDAPDELREAAQQARAAFAARLTERERRMFDTWGPK